MSRCSTALTLALALLVPAAARAADDETGEETAAPAPTRTKPAWRQEKHILEIGGYLGAFFPARDHGLYGGEMPALKPLKVGFDIGLRLAYMPLRFIGIEAEGGVSPTRVDIKDGERATTYAVRGHLILQLPTQLSLFVLAGGGMLGVSSKDPDIGKNIDGSIHFGGGLKYYVTPRVVLRIDGRDVISPAFANAMGGEPYWAHSGEFTFGAAFVLGRKTTKMHPKGT